MENFCGKSGNKDPEPGPWPRDWDWQGGKWVITAEIRAVLRRLVPFASRDVTRSHLQTVVVVGRYAYATDGHRAVRILLDQASPSPVRIPVDLVKAIKSGDLIEWWEDGTVRIGDIIQKTFGMPPPYEQAMHGGGGKEFTGDRGEILNSLRQWVMASRGVGYSGKIATLTAVDGGLRISAEAIPSRENWAREWLRANEETVLLPSGDPLWYGRAQVQVSPKPAGKGRLLIKPTKGKGKEWLIKPKEQVLLKQEPPLPVGRDLPAQGVGVGRWGVNASYLEDALVSAPKKGLIKIVLGESMDVIQIQAPGYLAVVMPRHE